MEANAGDEDGEVCTLHEEKADTHVAMGIHVETRVQEHQ